MPCILQPEGLETLHNCNWVYSMASLGYIITILSILALAIGGILLIWWIVDSTIKNNKLRLNKSKVSVSQREKR